MTKHILTTIAIAFCVTIFAGSASAETFWPGGDITTPTTWCDGTNPGPIILEAPVFVRSVLTILPGCIVRGQPRTLASNPDSPSIVGTPGALIVTQAGFLVADGSEDNPIIMTTAAVDMTDVECNAGSDGVADRDCSQESNLVPYTAGATFFDDTPMTAPLPPVDAAGNSNVSLWGGLVVLGSAPTNLGEVCGLSAGISIPYGSCTIEGLAIPGFTAANAIYGGSEAHDSSGIIRNVSVRHAGDEIANSNELNGVTLGGVGDGTILENVEVYCNFDDGFEWFGGTVNGRNLAVTFAGDDSIDMDQGYTGVNQNVFILMPFFEPVGDKHGDKIGELDGNDWGEDFNVNVRISTEDDTTATASSDEQPWPQSNPAIWNLTAIGSSPVSQPPDVPPTSPNDGIQMRNGFAGQVLNSIVLLTGTEEAFDVDDGDGSTDGWNACTDNVQPAADLIRVVASTTDDAALAGCDLQALANGDAAVARGDYNAPSTATNKTGASSILVDSACVFDPQGVGGKLSFSGICDPRTAGTDPGVTPQDTGLDQTATHRGAFPGGEPLWTDGWSVLSIGGVF